MFHQDHQEKTEPASPRKKEEARNRGYIPLSSDLNFALYLLSLLAVLALLFTFLIAQFREMFQFILNNISFSRSGSAGQGFKSQDFYSLFSFGLASFFKIILPLTLLPLIIAVISNLLQTNFLFTLKPLFPADGRFESNEGKTLGIVFRFSRLFSPKALYEGIKLFLKISVIGLLGYLLIRDELTNLVTLGDRGTEGLLFYFSSVLLKLGLRVVVVLILFGVGDYLFQKWQYQKDMRMSREELKRELKEEEGSPEMKGALKDFIEEKVKGQK